MKKAGLIIGWIAGLLVVAMNAFAAYAKFVPPAPGSQGAEFAEAVGMVGLELELGILEIAIIILFLIPRTMTVGFILMVGYMGGVLAAMLTHGFTHAEAAMIYVLLGLLAVCGWFRHPELTARLRGRPVA